MKNMIGLKYNIFGLFFFTLVLFSCGKDKLDEPQVLDIGLKNRVYIGTDGGDFYALDATNGRQVWKYTAKNFSYSDPIVANETVYAGSTDGNMYAFDAIDGALKWKFLTSTKGIESSPAISDNIIYFGSNNGFFYALNAATGELVWKIETSSNVSTSPVVANNIVYFGNGEGMICAANAKTGAVIWSRQTGSMFNQSSPILSKGVIFIGGRDGLYALNAADGTLKWKYSNGISMEMSTPTVVNGVVYIGGWYNLSLNTKGALLAIDEVTGKLITERLKGVGVGGDPYVLNGLLYVSTDSGYFYAFNVLTGDEVWAKNIYTNGAGAVIADGLVFIGGGGNKTIYAYQAKTGEVKWKNLEMTGITTSTPCVIDSKGVINHR